MKIPDRWLNYSNCGRINGTRFVACKVPLGKNFHTSLAPEKCFGSDDLLQAFPNIKLVIDLTDTYKYYNPRVEFEVHGVHYVKIRCKGHRIPDISVFNKFCEVVDQFLIETPPDWLIAVHCTHGVNRTGYIIIRYMIKRLGYSFNRAFQVFSESRGHEVERFAYINDLRRLRY